MSTWTSGGLRHPHPASHRVQGARQAQGEGAGRRRPDHRLVQDQQHQVERGNYQQRYSGAIVSRGCLHHWRQTF